ncbi:MAG TPA: ABC transporter ATP-binding protein [Bacillota bacterium]|nr:ABC transporter ATP-binding protein [Bacillota bacterium]
MIVSVRNLKKSYRKNEVLKGVNIEIKKPKIVALVGPNGSGKTTLFNCMTNLIAINKGTIELLGKSHTDPSIFTEMAYLQDNRILYGNLTAHDHLKFVCDVQNLPKSKITEVVERVGMVSYLKQRVNSFSLGMKQHLLLALAILNDPKLLLLDEPLNGLDPTSAINMRNILLELAEEGATIIVSSHNLAEIDRLTNNIYFMKDGEVLEESLEDFVAKEYYIQVNDIEKAKQVLSDKELPFSVHDQEAIHFVDTEMEIQTAIATLNEQNITITDIEHERVGAERRYRELFEGTE